MSIKHVVAGLVACGAMAVGAPAASAVTASVSGNTLTITGGPEVNQVELGDEHYVSPVRFDVSDTAGVTPGAGCTSTSPTLAACATGTITRVVMNLGGGDDSYTTEYDGEFGSYQDLSSLTVNGQDGNDTINATDAASGTDNAPVATLTGGAGDDHITGTSFANNTIDGGDGNDNISIGSDVRSSIHGGSGDDVINAGSGVDTIFGDAGHDAIQGTGGTDLINTRDGERDTVNCDILGTDSVQADQYDVVNKVDCSGGVTVTPTGGGGGGHATPRPRVKAFKAHCVKRHGKRRCTPAGPLKHHTYKGKASQGQKVTVGVDGRGRYVSFSLKGLVYRCSDGYRGREDAVWGFGDKQRLARDGTFSSEIDFGPGDGYSHEVIYVVGAFDGHKAKGAIVGNTQIAGHGECTSGNVSWAAST